MASKNNADTLASSFEFKSAHDLYNCLQAPHNLIVVDARSGTEYKSQSVRTAINIDWKISEKNSLKRLKEYSGPGKKFSLRKYFKLFIYDECEFTACSEGDRGDSSAWRLIDALMEEGTCKTPVYLLGEGFGRFRSRYPYLVHGHPALIQDVLPSEILEGRLYLGNAAEGKNEVIHGVLKIGAVVNCTLYQEFTIKGAKNQFRVAVDDGCKEDIQGYFHGVTEFMRHHASEGRAILVHCFRGMSRSATIVILYLMQECDMTLKQAYDFVKRKRATINPNPKFLKQLGEFELKLRGTSTIRFREKGPITVSTIYDWLIGAEWIPRVVITKPN